jgi:transcriptional regulator with XRE-family HTH domain
MGMSISGEQIRAARERARLQQGELAEMLGVSMRTIGNWERGQTVPRNRMAALEEALAEHLEPRKTNHAMLLRLGQLARQRREEKGLSRNLVASESGVKSETTIQNFEYGKTLPMPIYQKALEEVLEWKSGVIEQMMASGVEPGDVTSEMLDLPRRDMWPEAAPGSLQGVSLDELLGEIRRRVTGASDPVDTVRFGAAPSAQDEVMLAARELVRDTKRRKSAGKSKDLGDTPGKPAS